MGRSPWQAGPSPRRAAQTWAPQGPRGEAQGAGGESPRDSASPSATATVTWTSGLEGQPQACPADHGDAAGCGDPEARATGPRQERDTGDPGSQRQHGPRKPEAAWRVGGGTWGPRTHAGSLRPGFRRGLQAQCPKKGLVTRMQT